ncbi:MAG: glycosyltransferase family 2 protein [Actinomycetota bacterium]
MSDEMSGSAPKVSVITPIFNGLEFMDETIESVFAQTMTSWEMLLVDDGSTDGSAERARHYAERYPDRIRYLEHPGHVNLGQPTTRSLGMSKARGEYFGLLDVDDFWNPDKLARQCAVLDDHPDVAMVYNPYFIWYSWTGRPEDADRDERGEIGGGGRYDQVLQPPEMLLHHIRHETGIPATVSALVRRTVVDRVGPFESTYVGVYDDEAFFTKICLNDPVYVIGDCLDRYRQHENSFCAVAVRMGRWDRDPTKSSPDRASLLKWQYAYIGDHARFQRDELLGALSTKMRQLGVSAPTGTAWANEQASPAVPEPAPEAAEGSAVTGSEALTAPEPVRRRGLVARLRSLPFRRTRIVISEVQQTRLLLDDRMRVLDEQVRMVSGRLDAVAAQVGELDRRSIRSFEVLRFLADEEAENRRRVWAARADSAYEEAYEDPDPLVSVVIPTYTNWEGLRDRALPSVLAQDHVNLEVIVAGDAAPEETAQVISDAGDPRVRYVNLNRRGPYPSDPKQLWQVAGTPNANEAIRLARGRWIAFADDDDVMRPHHLSTLLAAAREHHAEVCYGRIEWHMPGMPRTIGLFPPEHGDFGHQGAIVHGGLRSIVFETSAALFDEPGDWHWCRRMLSAGVRFHMIDEIVSDVYPTVRDWHG